MPATCSGPPTDGAMYDPSTDSWTPIPPIDLPGVAPVDRIAAVGAGDRLVAVASTCGGGYDDLTWSPP